MKKLITLFSVLGFASSLYAQIAITEILFEAPSWDSDLQYIEVHNYTDSTFNVAGWSIVGDINLTTLPDLFIDAGESYVFASDILGMFDAGVIMDMGQWAAQKQIFGAPFFIIRDPNGQEVSRIEYETDSNWPVPTAGVAIELCDPMLNANDGSNWVLAENSITSGINALIGTPGADNTCGVSSTWVTQDSDIPEVAIFPNPCNNVLQIEQKCNRLKVFGPDGGLVLVANDTDEIDTTPLQPGIYHLLLFVDGNVLQQKFTKV